MADLTKTEKKYNPADTSALPDTRGETTVVAMVKSPYWLYCYWEIKAGLVKTRDPLAEKVLRLYDSSAEDYIFMGDTVVQDERGSCSVPIPQPDRILFVELGVISQGDYICLARTPHFRTPADAPSDRTDNSWPASDDAFEAIYGLSLGHGIGTAGSPLRYDSLS